MIVKLFPMLMLPLILSGPADPPIDVSLEGVRLLAAEVAFEGGRLVARGGVELQLEEEPRLRLQASRVSFRPGGESVQVEAPVWSVRLGDGEDFRPIIRARAAKVDLEARTVTHQEPTSARKGGPDISAEVLVLDWGEKGPTALEFRSVRAELELRGDGRRVQVRAKRIRATLDRNLRIELGELEAIRREPAEELRAESGTAELDESWQLVRARLEKVQIRSRTGQFTVPTLNWEALDHSQRR